MKSFKIFLLASFFTAVLFSINQSITINHDQSVAVLRVRTVPGSSDQKKKDTKEDATNKAPDKTTGNAGKSVEGKNKGEMTAMLAVVYGGTPR